jgi:hypothetical protein
MQIQTMMRKSGLQMLKPLRGRSQPALRSKMKTLSKIVKSLFAARKSVLHVFEDDVDGEIPILLLCPQQLISSGAVQPCHKALDPLFHAVLCRSHKLGGRRGSWRANVSGCVGNG